MKPHSMKNIVLDNKAGNLRLDKCQIILLVQKSLFCESYGLHSITGNYSACCRDEVVVEDEPELEDVVSEPDTTAQMEAERLAREQEEKAKVTQGLP